MEKRQNRKGGAVAKKRLTAEPSSQKPYPRRKEEVEGLLDLERQEEEKP